MAEEVDENGVRYVPNMKAWRKKNQLIQQNSRALRGIIFYEKGNNSGYVKSLLQDGLDFCNELHIAALTIEGVNNLGNPVYESLRRMFKEADYNPKRILGDVRFLESGFKSYLEDSRPIDLEFIDNMRKILRKSGTILLNSSVEDWAYLRRQI